jgi:periplasmic protein TonB
MSYADRDRGGSRIVAIVLVSLIVAGFGYAFVTGLAMSIAKKAAEKLNTFDVAPPPPPPPPDKPPPPPPDQPNLPPPPTQVTAPPVKLDIPAPNPIAAAPPAPPQVYAPPAPPAPVAPPAPPAPKPVAVKGGPKGNPGSWFSNDDYPADAKRANAQGRVTVLLNIDTGGRVADCRVTSSSGNSSLDAQTCNLAKRRGRFSVQKDTDGNAQAYTYVLPGIRWTLTDE